MEYDITHCTGVPELNDKQNIKMRYGAFYCCCFFCCCYCISECDKTIEKNKTSILSISRPTIVGDEHHTLSIFGEL